MQYRSKEVYQAMQFHGRQDRDAVRAFCEGTLIDRINKIVLTRGGNVTIPSHSYYKSLVDGTRQIVKPTDWIVHHPLGWIEVMTDEQFRERYEPVGRTIRAWDLAGVDKDKSVFATVGWPTPNKPSEDRLKQMRTFFGQAIVDEPNEHYDPRYYPTDDETSAVDLTGAGYKPLIMPHPDTASEPAPSALAEAAQKVLSVKVPMAPISDQLDNKNLGTIDITAADEDRLDAEMKAYWDKELGPIAHPDTDLDIPASLAKGPFPYGGLHPLDHPLGMADPKPLDLADWSVRLVVAGSGLLFVFLAWWLFHH